MVAPLVVVAVSVWLLFAPAIVACAVAAVRSALDMVRAGDEP